MTCLSYEGNFFDDARHGPGEMKMSSGIIYRGQWDNNTFTGEKNLIEVRDKKTGEVLSKYEGGTMKGKPEGQGTLDLGIFIHISSYFCSIFPNYLEFRNKK